MSYYLKERLFILVVSKTSEPEVPKIDEAVIWATGEYVGVKSMPGNIFNRRIMMQDFDDWWNLLINLLIFLYIPDADSLIWKSREQKILIDLIPTQTVPLTCMSYQLPQRLFEGSQSYISLIGGYGCDFRVRMTISSPIDFSVVLYFLDDGQFEGLIIEITICFILTWVHLFSLG